LNHFTTASTVGPLTGAADAPPGPPKDAPPKPLSGPPPKARELRVFGSKGIGPSSSNPRLRGALKSLPLLM
jgi:hypothetical protein